MPENLSCSDKYYVLKLEVVDNGANLGNPHTYFVSTVVHDIDTAWNAASVDTTAESNEDSDAVTTSHTFPKGITIYGMWDVVELNSGACITYVAPRHDYRNRA